MIAAADARPAFVEVVLAVPVAGSDGRFTYRAPDDLALALGHLVLVPFGPRRAQGVVVGLTDRAPVAQVRPVEALVDPQPVLSPIYLRLAVWIAERYLTPLGRVLALMAPGGLRAGLDMTLALRPRAIEGVALPPREQRLVAYLQTVGAVRQRTARARLGMADLSRVAGRLERRGYVDRQAVLVPPRPRLGQLVVLTEPGRSALDATLAGRAPRQAEVLAFLSGQSAGCAPIENLRAETGVDAATVRALIARGWLRREEAPAPLGPRVLADRQERVPRLTPDQARAVGRLTEALAAGRHRAFLLHGVTASGKTEVYLRLIAAAIAGGRRALVLVPEIALTPQALHRYGARLPGRVVAVHSRLTSRERFDVWRQIRAGRADVVVGSRSALFAPLANLGVIVVDEEHEPAYKEDRPPRYHAREVALELSRLADAVIVLGSATPDVVTYERAWRGELELLEMPVRVAGPTLVDRPPPLPVVELVDMRSSGTSEGALLSPRLVHLLGETLTRREQAILYLNRRGAATIVICAGCGHVPRCRRCDLTLTYHAVGDELLCHLCSRRTRAPATCQGCGSSRLQYFGAGTQRVVHEVQRLFAGARVLRWDRDAMVGRHAADELTRALSEGEADVLVGTQAIAKGLDLPGVTLVGIVSADTLLHLPDLRAPERTFQLLTQVAGRAGRGPKGGRVVLQSYAPEHTCIQAALHHDYAAFARHELRHRRKHGYPPYAELARAVYAGFGEAATRAAAARQAATLRALLLRQGIVETTVVGPVPCFYRLVRGRYRWQLIVRGRDVATLIAAARWPTGWTVDVDPASLL